MTRPTAAGSDPRTGTGTPTPALVKICASAALHISATIPHSARATHALHGHRSSDWVGGGRGASKASRNFAALSGTQPPRAARGPSA
eukprot:1797389-Prymnesium_polylepis.2